MPYMHNALIKVYVSMEEQEVQDHLFWGEYDIVMWIADA